MYIWKEQTDIIMASQIPSNLGTVIYNSRDLKGVCQVLFYYYFSANTNFRGRRIQEEQACQQDELVVPLAGGG